MLRHLPEVLLTLAAVTAAAQTGLLVAVPLWLFALLLVAAAGAVSVSATWFPGDCDDRQMHARMAIQVTAIAAVVYATGWGPALSGGLLFLVADNIKLSGSRAGRGMRVWAGAAVVLGQAGIELGWVPSNIALPVAHGIAMLELLVLHLVASRITRMTQRREEAEAGMRSSEQRFRNLVRYSSDCIVVIDGEERITYQSASTERVFGYDDAALLGQRFLDYIHPDDLENVLAFVAGMLEQPGSHGLIENRFLASDGTWRTVESNCVNLLHDPDVRGWVLNTRDISDRKALEDEIEHKAFHDELTSLANRALFTDRVEHVVARTGRRNQMFGLLFLDLDGFKGVNDTIGHAAGDELLMEVGDIIREVVRDADTAARLGGDEFAILLEDLRDQSDAARVAERLLASLREPFAIQTKDVRIDGSIGICVANGSEGLTADELLRNADIAMYMAKNSGKGRYEVFEPSMHVAVVERLELEADLHRAVERGEFELHYQPIVVLEDRRIVGVEALLRWNHPERGRIAPGEFIPLAEETGAIIPISRWVFAQACTQLAAWHAEFPAEPPMYMSVNLSARHLSSGSAVTDVATALSESGIDPSYLTLEITESALVSDTSSSIEEFRKLKALGIRLAIDDFGTGYSSLSYLQKFPFDVLKIDRSFIDGLTRGEQSPALVRAIVELGRSLELETVAEGIEHAEQLTRFRELRCHLGQGFLFARPADRDAITELLRTLASGVFVLDEKVIDLA
ncbi:MAG TPA: EAL domain-containing protein [Nitriliruptorales bacterium]